MGLLFSRFDYGTHETAIFKEDSVAESETQKDECKKPHDQYIKAKDFTMEHLPENYKDQDLYNLINTMAIMTVKIIVNFSSEQRNIFWQNTESHYPGYNERGKDTCMAGSGRIADVYQDTERPIKCCCPDCKESQIEKETWIVLVFTATHVVFDSSEAEKSNCRVIYDTEKGTSKTIHGVESRWSNIAGDLCIVECVTCDKELADELCKKIKTFNSLWRDIRKKYKADKMIYHRTYKPRLVVIVSHPHGGNKVISLGKLLSRNKRKIGVDKCEHLTYDVSTCPGSSGAPVYVYGQDWFNVEYAHSGTNWAVNYSTFWSS